MIFVTLGSQKFQFNRLLKAIDEQIKNGKISEEVFAQIGYSNYKPQNYKYKDFLNRDEFSKVMSKADIIITHGGTGAIIGAVKKGKKVIAVPRLVKYGEHVDNHQLQLVGQFTNLNLILECDDCNEIWKSINEAKTSEYNSYQSNTDRIIESIDKYVKITVENNKMTNPTDKIRIVHITKNMVINGISNVIISYCKNFDRNRFDITIITGNPIDNDYRDILSSLGIKVYKIPEKRKKPVKSYIKLFKLLCDNGYDIAHIHGNSRTIVIELGLAALAGIRVRIAHCHSTSCDFKIVHKITKYLFDKLCTTRIACSKEAGKWMFDGKKYYTVGNGIDAFKFRFDETTREQERTVLNVNNNFLIGHIGRFIEAKNHEFVLDIFGEIAKIIPTARLILVGEGPLRQHITNRAKEMMLDKKIIFYGTTGQPERLYNAMDVMVLPSRYEGLGIVTLEAQINQLPVICSSVVPQTTKISTGITYLDVKDYNSWVRKIISIYSDTYRRKNSNVDKDKVNLIDIQRIVNQVEDIYINEYERITYEDN